MTQAINALNQDINHCLIRDRHYFRRTLQSIERKGMDQAQKSQSLEALGRKIQASKAKAEGRRAAVPAITYPENLPVSGKVREISNAIRDHQVVIVAGETGSGKTTQIPKICLEMGLGCAGLIGHTQPRRLAARTVSQRIAEELNVEVGREVGYQVRFQDNTSEDSYIKIMTDGILLAETQNDRWLNKYDTLIIDEAHERSLNIDFLLGYIKQLLPKRPELKLIITSATIDVEKFSRHFGNAPIIEVTGRTYPVEIIYRPPASDSDMADNVMEAIREIQKAEKKQRRSCRDILVFLSGEREIRDVAQAIRKEQLPDADVFPLYARLSNKEQNKIFQPHHKRKIVLSTNVAETSLTVPGIAYVVDTGFARISRYSVRSKIQRLPIEAISQASANQRAGRCGRICPGLCIRLYDEEDFVSRPEYTDTEITRTNLASVILQMQALGLGDPEDFPFIDKPEQNAISDGYKLLEELHAIDDRRRLTKSGRLMARIPVDPKFARMILHGAAQGSLHEILIIVSALSIQDPRERPLDRQQAADEKHRAFRHPDSDFLDYVKLWHDFSEQRQQRSENQLRKHCQQTFLSWSRMREWREVHRQLHVLCKELGLKENHDPADDAQLHQALLSGLLSQVSRFQDDGSYLGARNRKYQIFPGSSLARKKVKWMVSAELIETSRLYARVNARIEVQWIESLAGHLLKHQYFEPHWEKKRGQVIAYESVSLYGLVIVEKRKLVYAPVDPVISREIFIREGLVAGDLTTRADFYHHNLALIEKVETIEDKTRRRDILVDEETLFNFYDQHIPADVLDVKSLEKWYRLLDKPRARGLFLTETDLINPESAQYNPGDFPDQLNTPTMALPLDYEFAPGKSHDGVSVDVPVTALKQLKAEDLDWLVPGMLREKCIALVRALPKPLRKNFVPVPNVIDTLLPDLQAQGQGSLRQLLAKGLTKYSGMPVTENNWEDYRLEAHLEMHIRVVDESGEVLDSGRDLETLKETFAGHVQARISEFSAATIEKTGLTEWSFGDLPQVYSLQHGAMEIHTYPALIDESDSVALRLLDSPYAARQATGNGVIRLLMLATSHQVKYLSKHLLQKPERFTVLQILGSRAKLLDQLIQAAYRETFLSSDELPDSAAAFDAMLERSRSELVERAQHMETLLYRILEKFRDVQKALKGRSGLGEFHLHEDIGRQLGRLVYEGFLVDTPGKYLQEIPRYLEAVLERLQKYPRQVEKDKQWTGFLQQQWERYESRRSLYEKQEEDSEALEDFRWMIEELRVSLFAQTLGTKYPVSEKRLSRFWETRIK